MVRTPKGEKSLAGPEPRKALPEIAQTDIANVRKTKEEGGRAKNLISQINICNTKIRKAPYLMGFSRRIFVH